MEACPRCGLRLLLSTEAELVDLTEEATLVRPLYGTVVVAEDTELIAEILKDGLVEEALAARVTLSYDGREFLTRCADYLYTDHPIDLAIVDLDMPILRGEAAAVALRAFEDGCSARRAPIIFFTARPIDDGLRSLMRAVKPAHYLNKGSDAAPGRIIKRLREIMKALQM